MATASLLRPSSSPHRPPCSSPTPVNFTLSPRTRLCHNSSSIERSQSPARRVPSVCMATCVSYKQADVCMESPHTTRQESQREASSPLKPTRDLYELLGVTHSATPDDIKRAFRQQARKFHPDINHTPGTEDLFLELRQAYEVLSDSSRRSQYDTALSLEAAKAHDPRLADYDKWRAAVVPDLQVQLASWTEEVDVEIEETSRCLTSMALDVDRRLDTLAAMAAMAGDCGSAQLHADYLEQADRLLGGVKCRLATMEADMEAMQNRIKLQYNRRYAEAMQRYGQYPYLVWIDIWKETSGHWLVAAQGNCKVWRTDKAALQAQVDKVEEEWHRMAAHAPKAGANA